MSRFHLAFAIGLISWGLSVPARAHAPPLASALPADAQGRLALLVTNRGLLFRTEAGPDWSLLCNEALGINTAELPNVVLLPGGDVLVGTTAGLRRTNDHGCSWADAAGFGTVSTPALAADAGSPDIVYAFTYAAGEGGLRKSTDGGYSFQLLYPTEDDDYVDSLLVASANADWIYATGRHFNPDQPVVHFLLRSTDAGAHWTRTPLPLDARDSRAAVLSTDPAQEQRVLIGTITTTPKIDPAHVLSSADGGQTFAPLFTGLEIASARFSEDGERVLVADQAGLHISEDPALSQFRSSSSASHLGCAFEANGLLLVCGHYQGAASAHSGVGVSEDGGASFSRWLDFGDVVNAVQCPSDSATSSTCSRPWRDWAVEMAAVRSQTEAATPGAAAPAPGPPAQGAATATQPAASVGDRSGVASSCQLSTSQERGGWLLLPVLLASLRRTRRSAQRARGSASGGTAPGARRCRHSAARCSSECRSRCDRRCR